MTRLAASVFNVPVAMVALVDEDRQWFKSCHGEACLGFRESPRSYAFCAHTVEAGTPVVVPDTLVDPRFISNPLVTGEPGIRFYAGAPLLTREGAAIGTLALLAFEAREFSEQELQTLVAMADMVSDEIARRQERDAARRSEKRLRALINSTSDVITILDAEGVITYQNAAIERVLGYGFGELLGQSALSLVHPDDLQPVTAALEGIVKGPRNLDDLKSHIVNFRFRHRDGSWRWLEAIGQGRLDDPAIAGIVISSRDVTDRRHAEAALQANQEHFGLALEAGVMGVWRADLVNKMMNWSPRVEQLHGFQPATFDGRFESCLQHVHSDDQTLLREAALRAIAEGLEFNAAYRVIEGGETRWLESRGALQRNGAEATYIIGVTLDISARKAAEERLRAEAKTLARIARAQNAIAFAGLNATEVLNEIVAQSLRLTGAQGAMILAAADDVWVPRIAGGEVGDSPDFYLPFEALIRSSVATDQVRRSHGTTDIIAPGVATMPAAMVAPLSPINGTMRVLLLTKAPETDFTERDEQTIELVRGLCSAALNRASAFDERHEVTQSLRDSQELNAAILETSLDCIVIIDHHGRVKDWNPAAERTFAYTRGEVLGQYLHELIIPPELREAHQRGLAKYLETGEGPVLGQRLELPAIRADGERITVELAIVPLPGANPPVFTGHLRDITARKADEAALQTATLEARRANAAKSEFLSRMSHELRTPLNAILGFGQLLETGDLSADDRESAEHITRAGKHLLELINEVLDIARIESGKVSLSIEPVEVRAVCREALALVHHAAAQRGLTLNQNCGGQLYVAADRQRFKQIVLNLLTNAVKYNRENGAVTLWCEETAAADGAKRVRIYVKDEGVGIAAEHTGRLFTPFDRLGAEQSGIEGTGIGLALSRRLAEAMNGSVGYAEPSDAALSDAELSEVHLDDVNPESYRGSTFWVELQHAPDPLANDDLRWHEAIPERDTVTAQEMRTIVYIEDNASNIELVRRIIERRGDLHLLIATDGVQGLEMVRNQRPDIVLLDLDLPGMSGQEVLQALCEDEATSAIPVIILSADATPAQSKRLLGSGAHAYLTKPFDLKEFSKLVDNVLN